MEKAMILKATEDTPAVILDKKKELFEISGRSLPEDAEKFYTPLHKWMDQYIQDPCHYTTININLEYFNSSSVKQILRLLVKLEKIKKTAKICWFYSEDDELMEIKGQEIKSILEVSFELKVSKMEDE